MDDIPSQKVIDFIFANYCTGSADQQTDDDDGIDESTIRAYLEFVSNIATEFDCEAFAMLKYYFIVTLATRPSKSIHFINDKKRVCLSMIKWH